MVKRKKWQAKSSRFGDQPTKSDIKDYFGRKVFDVNREVFEGFMWETPFLDAMAYYVIQGQLPSIRERTYKIGRRSYDNRVHGVAFLPSGSGKAGFTEYSGQLATAVGQKFTIMGDATDTALVGWKRFEQQYSKEEQRKETVVVEELGCLNPKSKNNIIHYNEADMLFDAKRTDYAKSALPYFQKSMNTYKSFDNFITRDTGPGRIEFHTSISFLIVSKPPEQFFKTITSTGFLQRTLMTYIAQNWERKKAADRKTVELFCNPEEKAKDDASIDDVVSVLLAINKYYRHAGKITVHKDAAKILKGEIFNRLHEPLEKMTPYAQKTMAEFVSRWQEQIFNLSYHNCYSRLGKQINVQDVADAKNIIYPMWKGVISAIEEGLEQSSQDVSKWRKQLAFIKKWATKLEKKYGDKGWIPRNALVKVLASRRYGWGCNDETARRRVQRAEDEGYLRRTNVRGSPVIKISEKNQTDI